MVQPEVQWRKKNGSKQGLHSCATKPNSDTSIMPLITQHRVLSLRSYWVRQCIQSKVQTANKPRKHDYTDLMSILAVSKRMIPSSTGENVIGNT